MTLKMTIFRQFAAVIATLLLINACSNDFELTEPSSDIAIVYGLLSAKDTANYVRVERAFIDENTSALTLSKDVNQLYFDNAKVTLTNVTKNQTFDMTRVDGNSEGFKRVPGTFADAPNYLYKLKANTHKLVEGDKYKISIFKGETLVSEGTTTVLRSYRDEDLSPVASTPLSFPYNSRATFSWVGDQLAVIHDLTLTINYREEKDGVITTKSVSWPVEKNFVKKEKSFPSNSVQVLGKEFYTFVKGAIDVDPLVKRYFKDIDITIESGGQEILDYVSVGQANLGITSSGEIPTYSNMSSGGLGLLSSKVKLERKKMTITPTSLDSLRRGQITKALNFQ
jgi:hypothetical protein